MIAMNKKNQTVLTEILKSPIAYHPLVAKSFGSVKLAVLWCQLYYWSNKTTDPDGWVYKTQKELFEETGLSRREQESARLLGKQLGVLEEKLKGVPAKMHFKVNLEKALEIIESYLESSSLHESAKQVCTDKPYQFVQDEQTITEITSETTPVFAFSKENEASSKGLKKLRDILEEKRLIISQVSTKHDKRISSGWQNDALDAVKILEKRSNKPLPSSERNRFFDFAKGFPNTYIIPKKTQELIAQGTFDTLSLHEAVSYLFGSCRRAL